MGRETKVAKLHQVISERTATVGVIGRAMWDLPVAVSVAEAGFRTIGFDVDQGTVEQRFNAGISHIGDMSQQLVEPHRLEASRAQPVENRRERAPTSAAPSPPDTRSTKRIEAGVERIVEERGLEPVRAELRDVFRAIATRFGGLDKLHRGLSARSPAAT